MTTPDYRAMLATAVAEARQGLAEGGIPIGAALYGAAASYARRHLDGVEPMVVATGCVCGAALVMVPAALFAWPDAPPGALAWGSAIGLGLVCTALAYVLYFRLLPRIGAARSPRTTCAARA